ncbi:MAG: hypothetical protein QXD61_06185 [Candidatus Caldarchaeum sp.]
MQSSITIRSRRRWREIGENLVQILYDNVISYAESVFPDRERQASLIEEIASLTLSDIADDYLPEYSFTQGLSSAKYRVADDLEVDKETLLRILSKMPSDLSHYYQLKLRQRLLKAADSIRLKV